MRWPLVAGAGCAVFLCSAVALTVTLDTFDAGASSGSVVADTSWVGNTTQNATSITVGGTAKNDNGWGVTGLSLNLSGLDSINITAQRNSGHDPATTFSLQFFDSALNGVVFPISTTAFNIGSLTTVSYSISALGGWGTVNPAQIDSWNIGGGSPSPGSQTYHMTFDNLSLSTTALSAIPEPSVVSTFIGSTVFVYALWRRRRARS